MSEPARCKYCGRIIVFYNPTGWEKFGLWVHKGTMDDSCRPVATPDDSRAAQPVGTAKAPESQKEGE